MRSCLELLPSDNAPARDELTRLLAALDVRNVMYRIFRLY